METHQIESKSTGRAPSTMSTSSGSNQLYIAESLELPEDTFRMSLDNFSVIGENVTIADRDTSIDTLTSSNVDTPSVSAMPTPTPTPETQNMPPEKSPPIIDTPKIIAEEKGGESSRKPPTLLQLSLTKKSDNDIFVKPSPVAEIMSPAKMLQFEVDFATSATPTMKRAVIDFDFFKKNNFDEYFDDVVPEEKDKEQTKDEVKDVDDNIVYEEPPIIVKPNTVRHEIGYGKYYW